MIEKHVIQRETWIDEIQDLKGKMQELMIEDDKELNDEKARPNQAESDLERYDQSLGELQQCLKQL